MLRHLGAPHHAGPVLGLATCIQRPVVATCGADRTIRLLNYLDCALELVRWEPPIFHRLCCCRSSSDLWAAGS